MNYKNCLIVFTFFTLFVSCKPESSQSDGSISKRIIDDAHSFGDNSDARVKHLSLNLKADFDKKTLSGWAKLVVAKNGADSLFLDSNNLNIESVENAGKPIPYVIYAPKDFIGSKIAIPTASFNDTITIRYATKPEALALQWLSPEQTYGKKHPFLYTQGQAVLTRSWIPIQDSPGIRFSYDAQISVPKGLMALMSAENPQKKSDDGIYKFDMKQPIPAYLVALAIGDLAFHAFDGTSGVYAEPEQLKAAAYEFAETPDMIKTAEELYGPYVWGRYDILILPPAFPFGGMENPRLTFATPTVIAGDRSLSSLIAHELAHSWSGNLVTNATWDDFWLNEGFTVYFERRIIEKVKGKDFSDMGSIIGRGDLNNAFSDFGDDGKETCLKLDLKGHNPDDGMTDVPYEKGYLFVVLLERTFGRDKIDAFLKKYFQVYKFKTITTEEFEDYIKTQLDTIQLDAIHLHEWLYNAGLPDNAPGFESKLFDMVEKEKENLLNGKSTIQYKDWDFNQWLYFINSIRNKATLEQLNSLNKRYHFLESNNSEILASWLTNNIIVGNKVVNSRLEGFLCKVGRRKFLTPLYKALLQSGQKDEASKIYRNCRSSYHSVSQSTLDELLGYSKSK
ncbi:MAG: M1 family metallopeptidase [Bacteroidetes bacterium]|jgi:leukotriene-A4 hydrolase|nr:M1 family metallopeptidase [Bacteroidota bacterium]